MHGVCLNLHYLMLCRQFCLQAVESYFFCWELRFVPFYLYGPVLESLPVPAPKEDKDGDEKQDGEERDYDCNG